MTTSKSSENDCLILPHSTGAAISPASSQGAYLITEDGRRLLDCWCGGGAFALGHDHRASEDRLRRALTDYDIGNHHLVSGPKGLLAKKLATLMPDCIERTLYTACGSEAVEAAIKLARGFTGRRRIVSLDCAYHGGTAFAAAAGNDLLLENVSGRAPGFVKVPFNDIEALDAVVDSNTAAFLFEPLPVEAGVLAPDQDYLEQAAAICRSRGALVVADESYTGIERTGATLACSLFNVCPDIVVAGRALCGGIYPLAATCYSAKIDGFLVEHPFIHVSTFGGSEAGCMTVLPLLNEMTSRDTCANIARRGTALENTLKQLARKKPQRVADFRSIGLLAAIECIDERTAATAVSRLFEQGVYCRTALLAPKAILLLPPLNIGREEIEQLCRAIEVAFDDIDGGE